MLFYIILFVSATLFAFLCSHSKNKYVALLCSVITFLILFIPSALRYNVGADYPSYVYIFYNAGKIPDMYIEPGFQMLNIIIRNIGLDVQWIFAIMAFFTILFFFLSVHRKTLYLAMPLFVTFFYRASFNAVRGTFAIMMAYYAYTQFIKEKYIKAVVVVLIAMQIHRSIGVILLLFLIMYLFRIKKVHSFAMFCLIFCSIPIIDRLTQLLLTGPFLPDRFQGMGSVLYAISGKISRGAGVFFRFLWYAILLFFVKTKTSTDKSASNIRILLVAILFTDIFASFSLNIMYRVVHIFAIVWLIAIHHFNTTSFYWRKPLVALILLYSFVLFCYETNHGMDLVVPYKSVLIK